MQQRKPFPEINRLSIVAAGIMLAFALTQLISFPARIFSVSIFGVALDFNLNFQFVINSLTVVLAAAGMDWLIHSHPAHDDYTSRWAYIRHWIMPVLTSLVIGIALNSSSGGPYWWVIFGFGSLLLITVLIAEYNIVSVDDIWYPVATVGLTSLSFALYLLLAIAVAFAKLRLYTRLPLLSIGLLMVVSRSLYLRLGKWLLGWTIIVTVIVSEIAIGLHYLPLSPIQYGVGLVGISYGLTSVISGIQEARKDYSLWAEPAGMLIVVILVSVLGR